MKRPIHRIFEETGCVRQDALLHYRDNELSDEDKHDIERHLVDCELCSDALEGLSLGASASFLDEVREEVMDNIAGRPGTSTFNTSARWLVAAAVSAVVVMSIYTYMQFDKVDEGNMAFQEKTTDKSTPVARPEKPADESAGAATSEPEPVDETQEVAKMMDVKPQPAARQAIAPEIVMVEEEEADFEADSYPSETVADMMEDAEFMSESTQAEIAAPKAKKESITRLSLDSNKLLYSAAGQNLAVNPAVNNITYLNNYKVFNAPDLQKGVDLKDAELKSVSPRYENKNAAKVAEAPPVERKELTYEEALELALIDFDNQRYTKALDRLNLISNARPNDLNVDFYTGMSNYNMSNYSEALKDLEPITNDKSGVFNEEAYYYTALCYYKTGKTKKGIRMLNDIANSGGFYANDAKMFIETNR